MFKTNFFIFSGIFSAMIFGILGHEIAYFMIENLNKRTLPYYMIITLTISISLYLCTSFLAYVLLKKQKIERNKFKEYIQIVCTVSSVTTIFSLIELIMS